MDNLPHHTNSLTSTTTSSTTLTTTTQWDLAAITSMDADHHLLHHHHHHEILHDHPNQALFPFASLPTWSNYSSVPLPPLPSSSSSFMSRQLETLVEGEEKEEQLVEEEQEQEEEEEEEEEEELGAVKEMMYKIAAMQPVEIDPATIRKPKRRNVRISDDPQSVAARLRRERISEKIRILQRLVPGGTKLDTASMLEEAVRYVKFLKRQIRHLQQHPAPPLLAPPTTTTTAATRVTAPGDIGGELPLCFSFNEG